MSSKQMEFALVFTGRAGGAKAAAVEVKQATASVTAETEKSSARALQHAAALDKEAASARKTAEATRVLAAEEKRAADYAARIGAVSMDRMVNAFAGITAPAANRNGRAADIAAYGAELDRLRARFDPLFAAQQRYKQKLEEISHAERVGAISASAAIDLRLRETNAYNTLTSRVEGQDAARKAMIENAVSRATITPNREADVGSFLDQRDTMRARFNPVFSTLTQYKTVLAEIREAHRLGVLSTDEMAAAISRERREALAAVAAHKGRAAAAAGQTERADQFRRQVLGYQIFDIAQTGAMGMSPAMIFAQQGPQVIQMYAGQGGINAALKDFSTIAGGAARMITPLTAGLGLLAAAVTTGAMAYAGYLQSIKEVETAADGLGRAVAGSAADMEAAAQAGAAAAGISVKSARSMEAQFLRTGRIGSEHFEQLIGLSKDFAATIGVDAGAAGDTLAEMFANPAEAAEKLYRQYGLIDAATARNVANLAAQNRQSEAQGMLLDALPSKLANAEQATTALGRAWDWTARKASETMDAIGSGIDRMASGPSLADQIKDAQREYERFQNPSRLAGWLNGAYDRRDQAKARLDDLVEEQRRRSQFEFQRQRQAQDIAQSRAAIDLANGSGATADMRRRQELENSIAALRSVAGNSQIGTEDRANINAALEAKTRLLDVLINKQGRALELDRLDIQISNERNPVLRAELEARRTRLQMAEQEVSADTIAAEAARARNRVIEETISSASSQAADMRQEIEIRAQLMAQVNAGTVTMADANRLLQEEITLRPLIAAAASAEGAEKARLTAVIAGLRDSYAELAEQEKRMSAMAYLQTQSERLDKLRLENSLVGTNEEARKRAIALLEVEQEITRRGLDRDGDLASRMRDQADAATKLTIQLERQGKAWDTVRSAGENTLDTLFDKALDGDFTGALEQIGKDWAKTILELGAKNPMKNAWLGTNLPTMGDVGGLGGLFSSLFGGGMSTGSMSVNAATVTVNGGLGGISALSNLAGLSPANDNFSANTTLSSFLGLGGAANDNRAAAGMTNQGGVAATIWNFFAGKGLKDFQIAGILGNVKAESAFNPLAVGDGGNAFGLFQHNDRSPALLNFLGGRQNLGNVNGQLDFVWKELQSSEGRAFQALLNSRNVREATSAFGGFERPNGFSWNNPEGMHNWNGRLAGAEQALAQFRTTTSSATEGLGTLGTGLDKFGNALSSMQLGGGGGGAGSLLGGFNWSSLFSPSWAPNTTLGQFLGAFSDGGYTGPGGVDEPRGVVHAGEVVWSQRDVARAGGPHVVDAMRLGKRGYSFGGIVDATPYSFAQGPAAFPPANQNGVGTITVNNYSSSKVETEETTDDHGNRHVSFTIADQVGSALAQRGGGAQRHLERAYGLKQRGPRR